MIDKRIGQHKQVASGVSNQFGISRMLPGIRNDIRVAESFAAGQPVRYYSPKCRATEDYQHFTGSVIELLEKPVK